MSTDTTAEVDEEGLFSSVSVPQAFQVVAALSHYSEVPKNRRSQLRCALSKHKDRGELAFIFPRRKLGQNQREERSGPVWLTREMVLSLAVDPITQAAEYLGISATALKRACRQLKIERWPYNRPGVHPPKGGTHGNTSSPDSAEDERCSQGSHPHDHASSFSGQESQQPGRSSEKKPARAQAARPIPHAGMQPATAATNPTSVRGSILSHSMRHSALQGALECPTYRKRTEPQRHETAMKCAVEAASVDHSELLSRAHPVGNSKPMIHLANHFDFEKSGGSLGGINSAWMTASFNKTDVQLQDTCQVNKGRGDTAVTWHNRSLFVPTALQNCRNGENEDFCQLRTWAPRACNNHIAFAAPEPSFESW